MSSRRETNVAPVRRLAFEPGERGGGVEAGDHAGVRVEEHPPLVLPDVVFENMRCIDSLKSSPAWLLF